MGVVYVPGALPEKLEPMCMYVMTLAMMAVAVIGRCTYWHT